MINIIVAMTKKGVIGRDNNLPWHLPEDLQNFKRLTDGKVVVMGRKTYESIPEKFRPLPNRHNVVISRSMQMEDEEDKEIDICRSVEEALMKVQFYGKEVFIIGGSTIYQQTLPHANKMYISYVRKDYQGDTYFPEFNKDEWEIENRQDFQDFEMVVYRRK